MILRTVPKCQKCGKEYKAIHMQQEACKHITLLGDTFSGWKQTCNCIEEKND